jgi:hypothetical protein
MSFSAREERKMIGRISALLCAVMIAFTAAGCSDSTHGGDASADRGITTPIKNDSSIASVAPDRLSGFYDSEFDLTLSTIEKDAKIYYTTDGSDPDLGSSLYTGPIHIKNRSGDDNVLSAKRGISASNDYIPSADDVRKGTVIKAAVIKDDGSRGEIFCGSYFVGIDREACYKDVPIISVTVDEDSFYDYETGIYVLGKRHDDWLKEDNKNEYLDGWQHEGNYSLRGKEWERPANVEMIEPDGSIAFSQVLGVRIKGGASRNDAQKSLKFVARDEYGKKNIKCELIPGNMRSDGTGTVDKYKSFAIRNGGNDNNSAKIRDPLFQGLVEDRDFETMQYRPCVAFINGEYWGLYTLIEDYSDNYFENNYPVESDNVVLIKRNEVEEGTESDLALFKELVEFINGYDMSIADNYKAASEMLDMQSFADYCAFELYIHNEDCLFRNDNNWRMWRVRTPVDTCEEGDGRWRMVLYDTDYSAGIYSEKDASGESFLSKAMSGADYEDDQIAKMVSSLCRNSEFRKMFANALLDMRNFNFERTRVSDRIDELSEIYVQLIPETAARFGPDYVRSPEFLNDRLSQLTDFLMNRYNSFPDIVRENLGLGELHTVVIKTGTGNVLVNTTLAETGKEYKAQYLSECPITLTAVAPEGKRFVRWETVNLKLSDPSVKTISIAATGDCEITAVFE